MTLILISRYSRDDCTIAADNALAMFVALFR